jgi:tetrapyrrole methylase family protein/MazG family protein
MAKKDSIKSIQDLLETIQCLRSPEGCPWDRKQTHVSLKPMLIEEAAELLDAIDARDDENIREELGDILMHVVFHSLIAEEEQRFTFSDVVEEIVDKMKRRHPHVFGKRSKMDEADQVVELWDELKAVEKSGRGQIQKSILDGIPKNLPALLRSEIIQKKAAAVGFDWDRQSDVLAKIEEELSELKEAFDENNSMKIDEEIGDLLFSLVNLSRFRKGLSAEKLLHNAIDKFEKRFHFLEDELSSQGKLVSDCSIDEFEDLWQKSKNISS